MDMMELRRMVMAQMSATIQGADYAKGTFTTDTNGTYTLSFGKTFESYLYYIEMTDDSKTALKNTGHTSARMYACMGIYPKNKFDGNDYPYNAYAAYRVVPSTDEMSLSTSTQATAIDGSSISFTNVADTGSGANNLYRGYSYNYYIVEIK